MSWDIEEYNSRVVIGKEEGIFPNLPLKKHSSPLTVVDCKERLILWYLPGLLLKRHQVSFCRI
jgi:hypothetical protein